MPIDPELEQALKDFRQDVLEALAELKAEIETISAVLSEGDSTREALQRAAQLKQGRRRKATDRYAEKIRLAHQLR